MDYIEIVRMPPDFLVPDEDGDVTELKENTEYHAADKGDYYRIYVPEDANIPKENVRVIERDA